MPLTDPRAIEIISKATRPNVAKPRTTDRDFERIFDDFFARWNDANGFAGQRVVDLGPGQFDFARMVHERGGTCENIDYDPAVIELGAYLGFTCYDMDLKSLDAAALRHRFDGVFCKFSINALWDPDPASPVRVVEQINALLRPGGWGWIAPWNGRSIPALKDNDDAVRRLLEAQRGAFEQCGWSAHDLSSVQAGYYGVTGSVENHVLFLKNLPAPKGTG